MSTESMIYRNVQREVRTLERLTGKTDPKTLKTELQGLEKVVGSLPTGKIRKMAEKRIEDLTDQIEHPNKGNTLPQEVRVNLPKLLDLLRDAETLMSDTPVLYLQDRREFFAKMRGEKKSTKKATTTKK